MMQTSQTFMHLAKNYEYIWMELLDMNYYFEMKLG